MAIQPIRASAINAAQMSARLRLANDGHEASNLFVRQQVVPSGTVFQPDHDRIRVAQDSLLVFVDDQPTLNWGHKCRYLLHDPADGRLIQEVPALLPPSFDFGREFKPFHIGTPLVTGQDVPKLAVRTLPPWTVLRPQRTWHAILYAGASNNRHVNDIEFLYRTLVHTYRVLPANITVLNHNGTLTYNDANWAPITTPVGNWPGDNTPYQMKVTGAGTRQAMLDAIAAVGKKLQADDCLLVHTNNHGGRQGNVSTLCTFSGAPLLPSEMAAAMAKLPRHRGQMVMMEQCFAGGFIDALKAASTADCFSIATAVDALTSSAGGANFDPYALAWIKAMAETSEGGGTLSPAAAHDAKGHVTARAAFDWAKANNPAKGDNCQFAENAACGGALWLGPVSSGQSVLRIPEIVRRLWPWEIIPDPSPEQIKAFSDKLDANPIRGGADFITTQGTLRTIAKGLGH